MKESDATLCSECGETLAEQGYCPICEQFWALPEGAECPKHDVALDDGPMPRRARDQAISWVTIATYLNPIQAEAPRIRLEAEGIPTFLEGERMGVHNLFQVATGGVKLQVPRELASEARVVIAQRWRAPETDDDLEDAWDELAPEPGARRRATMKAMIILFLAWPLLALALSALFHNR